ncbi:hypothetical protein JTB14_035902 [Gonioctena quinquepunctata]|nr:hypothetical protein JTB14_035902 [Gonioctena quinquepunctata]
MKSIIISDLSKTSVGKSAFAQFGHTWHDEASIGACSCGSSVRLVPVVQQSLVAVKREKSVNECRIDSRSRSVEVSDIGQINQIK